MKVITEKWIASATVQSSPAQYERMKWRCDVRGSTTTKSTKKSTVRPKRISPTSCAAMRSHSLSSSPSESSPSPSSMSAKYPSILRRMKRSCGPTTGSPIRHSSAALLLWRVAAVFASKGPLIASLAHSSTQCSTQPKTKLSMASPLTDSWYSISGMPASVKKTVNHMPPSVAGPKEP